MKYMLMVCFAFVIGVGAVTEVIADSYKNRSVKTEKRNRLNNESKIQKQVDDDEEGAAMEDFFIEKYVESNIENYSFRFDIDVPLKNVKKVQVKAPNGKKTIFRVKDKLDLTALCSEADELYANYEDFQNAFPEGNYTFTFTPKKYRSLTVYMKHDFPSIPIILSPEEGTTVSASGLAIEWEDMVDEELESLTLIIDDDNGRSLEIPVTNTTSFNVPDGLLEPDTEYWIELRAGKRLIFSNNYDENCKTRTVRSINFFTGAE